jgi:hypothetical protein
MSLFSRFTSGLREVFSQLFAENTSPPVADITAEQFFDFAQYVKNLSDSDSRDVVKSKADLIFKHFLENKSPASLTTLPRYLQAIFDLRTVIGMTESSKRPVRQEDWDFIASDFVTLARRELGRLNSARRVGIERIYPLPL